MHLYFGFVDARSADYIHEAKVYELGVDTY